MEFDIIVSLTESIADQEKQTTDITRADAQRIGNFLKVDWNTVNLDEFHAGIRVELEHRDITHGDIMMTAKIALAHLRELPDYYTRLAQMETP